MPWIADLPAAVRRSWLDRQPAGEFPPLRVLLVYAGVVLIFFSASRSKLAPYILPLVPPLATVIGIHVAERFASLRRAAWISAGAVALSAVGLLVHALHRYDVAPVPLLGWIVAAVLLVSVALLNIELQKSLTHNVAWLAAASVLAWQCLLVAHGTAPLERSARTLVTAVRPAVDAQTMLFSVGQYRQSVPLYLKRTLTLVEYTGELAFGMEQEPGLGTMGFGEFERQWRASKNAVAFFDPEKWQALSNAGFPGRILGADRYSIAVSRQ
jgi:4-amino-4-deoxy-L-arabinose transferase-like glycosyltransferase